MHGIRLDRLLAGTALVLVLTSVGLPAYAAPDTDAKIEALVPVPEPANVPPPTASDVASPSATPAATEPAASRPARAVMPASEPASQPAAAVAPAAPPATAVAPAAEPEKAAAAAPAAPTLDQQVAEKLKAALTKGGRKDKALETFYAARDYAPVWVADGNPTARAKAASDFIGKIDADALDPADYPLPEFKTGSDPAVLADAELKFTSSILTFARHASNGRVHWSRICADIYYAPVPFEAAEAMTKIAEAKDVTATLDGFNPQQPGYKALKAKLAEARGMKDDAAQARVAHGPVLKIVTDRKGRTALMEDARVPALRARLGLDAVAHDTFYDQPLADAVRTFQRQSGLAANGQLTAATVDALNGVKKDKLTDIIIANMERWRWLPRDLGKSYVMLNIPDFTLRVMKDGAQVWTTRVVVGQPAKPTPILSETMKYITVNPTWNVPPSIIYNEYLPALQQDPTVLDRMGLKLEQNRDGSVHISQPPGERNALGRIRFNFPNKFLVYQHDTPDKYMFAHERRAYSHGCMRIQDPDQYAEALLSIALPHEGYTAERIRRMYGHGEVDLRFPTPIPVHLTYQTAYVDSAGKLVLRDDVYGRDARVIAALKGDERKMADIPMERAQPSYSRPPVRLPERYAGSGYGGGSFFERLFGGGPPEPPAPVRNNRRTFQR